MDSREKKWKKQRKKRGFDDHDLWDLDIAFRKWLEPRLIAFERFTLGWPSRLESSRQWKKELRRGIKMLKRANAKDGTFDELDAFRAWYDEWRWDLWY